MNTAMMYSSADDIGNRKYFKVVFAGEYTRYDLELIMLRMPADLFGKTYFRPDQLGMSYSPDEKWHRFEPYYGDIELTDETPNTTTTWPEIMVKWKQHPVAYKEWKK